MWLALILRQNEALKNSHFNSHCLFPLLFFGFNTKCRIWPLTAWLRFKCATVRRSKAMPCIRRCSCTKHYTCLRIQCDEKTITSALLPFTCFSCPAQVPPRASINLNSVGSGTCRCEKCPQIPFCSATGRLLEWITALLNSALIHDPAIIAMPKGTLMTHT